MAGNFRPEKCIGKKELVLDKDIIVNYANGYMSDNSFSALFDGNMCGGNGGGVFMWCGTYGDAPYYTTLIFNFCFSSSNCLVRYSIFFSVAFLMFLSLLR